MLNANATKWVEALRSGKYDQAQGRLHSPTGFCCLGVACEVYRRETGHGHWEPHMTCSHFVVGEAEDGPTHLTLPVEVRDWLGLRDDGGYYHHNESLIGLNDDGTDFAEIADVIESEPEGLFLGS